MCTGGLRCLVLMCLLCLLQRGCFCLGQVFFFVQVRQISLGTLGFVCDVAYVSHVYLFAAQLFG